MLCMLVLQCCVSDSLTAVVSQFNRATLTLLQSSLLATFKLSAGTAPKQGVPVYCGAEVLADAVCALGQVPVDLLAVDNLEARNRYALDVDSVASAVKNVSILGGQTCAATQLVLSW